MAETSHQAGALERFQRLIADVVIPADLRFQQLLTEAAEAYDASLAARREVLADDCAAAAGETLGALEGRPRPGGGVVAGLLNGRELRLALPDRLAKLAEYAGPRPGTPSLADRHRAVFHLAQVEPPAPSNEGR